MMNEDQILDAIRKTATTLRDVLAVLEDGAALASIGVTDADQLAVEEAHATIKASLTKYNAAVAAHGEYAFEGRKFALIAQAELTNRLFDGSYQSAQTGEDYITEYDAPAIGDDGDPYTLIWQFTVTKGSEPDADTHDWDSVWGIKYR